MGKRCSLNVPTLFNKSYDLHRRCFEMRRDDEKIDEKKIEIGYTANVREYRAVFFLSAYAIWNVANEMREIGRKKKKLKKICRNVKMKPLAFNRNTLLKNS